MLSSSAPPRRVPQLLRQGGTWTGLAAFLVPGVALWLPSGYSWGALLLLLVSLASVRSWWGRPWAGSARWLAASFVGMACVWLLDADTAQGLRSLDRPVKYGLALLCMGSLVAWPPRATVLAWGVAVGAAGSGLLALAQTELESAPRATGFTNAIQYGNLSLLLGWMCGLWLAILGSRLPRWQWGLWLGAMLLGALGSLLSQSRGGWLALALSLPLWAWLLARWRSPRLLAVLGSCMALFLVLAAATHGKEIQQRLHEVYAESTSYWDRNDAQSSVGQRLDHWRLAWSMGLERPWFGWGHEGYRQEKRRQVELGQAQPIVLQYEHAHNEALDLFAKRGIAGVAALLFFYAVPWMLFWPTPGSLGRAPCSPAGDRAQRERLALHLMGLSLPVLYLGFGLTQAFLAHNSGNMFYLFMVMLLYAALRAHPQRS